jgi:hypothetical protein
VKIAESPPARSLGIDCLPANVAPTVGLHDIRGYDGIDPGTLVELLKPITDRSYRSPSFAETQWFVPVFGQDHKTPGIVDMLNVRYLIFRGHPPNNAHPLISGDDYWVLENNKALPRVFVPRRVQVVSDKDTRLSRLAADDFDPSAIAFVPKPLALPETCHGTAEIVEETPTRSVINAHMETPGLLVVSERWENGWNAYIDDKAAPVIQANHALRAVSLPAGDSRVVFRYEPPAFALGVKLMAIAGLILLVGTPLLLWSGRNRRTSVGGQIACPQP